MPARILRFLQLLSLAMIIAAGLTGLLALFWWAIGGGAMSIHGWIAMGLGLFGTVGLAWVLMALAFRSDREGWDDQVDNTLDPGRPDERRDRR